MTGTTLAPVSTFPPFPTNHLATATPQRLHAVDDAQ